MYTVKKDAKKCEVGLETIALEVVKLPCANKWKLTPQKAAPLTTLAMIHLLAMLTSDSTDFPPLVPTSNVRSKLGTALIFGNVDHPSFQSIIITWIDFLHIAERICVCIYASYHIRRHIMYLRQVAQLKSGELQVLTDHPSIIHPAIIHLGVYQIRDSQKRLWRWFILLGNLPKIHIAPRKFDIILV